MELFVRKLQCNIFLTLYLKTVLSGSHSTQLHFDTIKLQLNIQNRLQSLESSFAVGRFEGVSNVPYLHMSAAKAFRSELAGVNNRACKASQSLDRESTTSSQLSLSVAVVCVFAVVRRFFCSLNSRA